MEINNLLHDTGSPAQTTTFEPTRPPRWFKADSQRRVVKRSWTRDTLPGVMDRASTPRRRGPGSKSDAVVYGNE